MNFESLKQLQLIFLENKFDIKLCGGCVRDHINGDVPVDIDLCTNANPEEQETIYKLNNIKYYKTGMSHGTLTVLWDEIYYEITSLRIDKETDGRHAIVEYTTDWDLDLSRRDFTFNAMLMDMDQNIYDPFNGQSDLKNGIVKFVGDPAKRIKEDYLRILRWFRFHGRYGKHYDQPSINAIFSFSDGLENISRERIWNEISKILKHERNADLLGLMRFMGIFKYINLKNVSIDNIRNYFKRTKKPELLMALGIVGINGQTISDVCQLAKDWKWSNQELKCCQFVIEHFNITYNDGLFLVSEGENIDWVYDIFRIQGKDYIIKDIPVFPLNGDDMMKCGLVGKEIGDELKRLKLLWKDNDFTL